MTVPALPRPVGRRSFLKQTVVEWESWPWDTWNPSQVAHATRTIVLIDDLNRASTAADRVKLDQPVRQALRVLGLTKSDDEDQGPSEEDIAEAKRRRVEDFKIRTQREAIRLGADAPMVRDRGGQVHDTRNILIADSWATDYPDQQLQDERQADAEASGTWPDAAAQIQIAEGADTREEA